VAKDDKNCFSASADLKIISQNVEIISQKEIKCNDSIRLIPSLIYPAAKLVKLFAPDTSGFMNLGMPTGWGGDILTAFAGGEAIYEKDNDLLYTGCSNNGYPSGSLKNKIALIDRGGCAFSIKAYNAQKAGASGVIIINDVPGSSVSPMATGDYASQVKIPVVMLSNDNGKYIRKIMADSGYAKISMGYDGNKLKFKWTPEEGLDATDVFSPYANPKIKTRYTVQVNSDVCSSSAETTVNIIDAPGVNLGKDTAILPEQSITLHAGKGFKTYLWSNGSINDSITLKGVELGLGEHEFSVTVTDGGICKGTDEIIITVRLNNNIKPVGQMSYGLNIYPNPANSFIVVSCSLIEKAKADISMFDVTLREIKTIAIVRGSDNQFKINTSGLKEGVYFLMLRLRDDVAVRKIVVVN
jgi:hypothetical protein